MAWVEVAAGSVSALFGVFLSSALKLQEEKAKLLTKSQLDIYAEWVQLAENMGTWAFNDVTLAQWQEKLHNIMAKLQLFASEEVMSAVVTFYSILDADVLAAVVEQVKKETPDLPDAAVSGIAFGRVVQPHRAAVIKAMRSEVMSR